ncbi:MAG: hypothetical protein EP298_05585 [Gammaproteobacteria bacterium]|nr:MAG: hypothetical protein EP298_05585 [Gammaproteobacteria bacterium]UTW42746.1 hypothetical protein KFE69_00950 [bacterium SCSIO 12844]
MKQLIRLIIGLLLIAYPFIIYFGLSLFTLRYLIIILGFIFVLRLFLMNWLNQKAQFTLSSMMIILMVVSGLMLCLFALIFDSHYWILLYPFFVNVLLFLIFLYSFIFPPTMIERFASVIDKQPFPKEAITYMRKVTLVWMVFFIINGLIAIVTALFTSMKIWTLYNGLIAYILIGLIFIVEYMIRLNVKRKLS